MNGRGRPFYITRSALLALLVFAINPLLRGLDAQETVHPVRQYPPRINWGAYDPFYVVTSRVYAQADLIRAQGDAAVGFAQARNLNAEAYSKELDNWMKQVRVYWDRKITAEQKRLELDHVRQIARMKYLNNQKWRNSRTWDRLKNHPNMSQGQISNGKALTFLLERLAASSLPYQFDSASSRFGPEALRELRLDNQWFGHIRLKQGPFTFAADQTVRRQVGLWPYLLRWEEFDASRSDFEKARTAAVQESENGGEVSVPGIKKMQTALFELTNEFHRSKTVKEWVQENRRYVQFAAADRFLRELDREIVRLEKTGDIRPLRGNGGYDPKTDGDHVISLLCFMNRNGIEFAPAQPGNEFAYHNLFVMMRSLYLTVAEQDESIQPKNLGKEAVRQ